MANTATAQNARFSVAIQTEGYKRLINQTLQDPNRARRFIANIMSAYSINPVLQECEPASILSCGLLGESLGLSASPQLGEFYMVPYEDKKAGVKKAQFQIGYIGLKQMAMNTGLYRRIDVISVKKGELIRYDPFTGNHGFKPITDPIQRAAAETIGYYGYYELINGYKEDSYWSKEEMLYHANRYSKAFNLSDYKNIEAGNVKQADMWKYSSPWYTAFEAMAHKTIIRHLLKTAPKSAEMRNAYEADNSTIAADLTPEIIVEDIPVIAGAITDAVEGAQIDESTGEVIDEPGGAPEQVSLDDL